MLLLTPPLDAYHTLNRWNLWGRAGAPLGGKRVVLVAGDAAVDDGLLAGVDDDEGKVDDGVGRRGSVRLLFRLSVPLHQILKRYLLRKEMKDG